MKFEFEIVKTLRTTNSKGELCVIGEGDELWLKVDFPSVNLYDHQSYIRRYPDGWVKGTVRMISDAGDKLYFSRSDVTSNLLVFNLRDVLDVSDKAPRG